MGSKPDDVIDFFFQVQVILRPTVSRPVRLGVPKPKPHHVTGAYSASNRYECQMIFLGLKRGQLVRLTT
jgi:hypothetical protein